MTSLSLHPGEKRRRRDVAGTGAEAEAEVEAGGEAVGFALRPSRARTCPRQGTHAAEHAEHAELFERVERIVVRRDVVVFFERVGCA